MVPICLPAGLINGSGCTLSQQATLLSESVFSMLSGRVATPKRPGEPLLVGPKNSRHSGDCSKVNKVSSCNWNSTHNREGSRMQKGSFGKPLAFGPSNSWHKGDCSGVKETVAENVKAICDTILTLQSFQAIWAALVVFCLFWSGKHTAHKAVCHIKSSWVFLQAAASCNAFAFEQQLCRQNAAVAQRLLNKCAGHCIWLKAMKTCKQCYNGMLIKDDEIAPSCAWPKGRETHVAPCPYANNFSQSSQGMRHLSKLMA